GAAQVEALLKVDARLEPIIAQLTQQYVTNYQKSSAVESRLWHSVFDLVKAFVAAYHASLMSGFPRAESKRWRAILPWVLVRLVHYKGLDGKFRLFRYSHWIPAQWRDFHELYEFGRIRSWQPETEEDMPQPGDLPPREQRLLLMRLAALFGPEAIAHAPRAARHTTDGEVRVVVGLQALTRAVAEIERLPDAARTPGVSTSFDEVTQVMPGTNPESITRRIKGTTWKIVDRSDTGCRLIAPVKDAPARLGELVAIKEGDHWVLAV